MSREETALTAAHAEVKAELARTDTKASLLLAFNGAVLAGVASLATSVRVNLPAAVVGGVGVAVLVASVAVLLATVCPNLGGGGGFPHWATLTPDELRAHLGTDRLPHDIGTLARIAVAKFGRLRQAIHLTCAAGALLVWAAGLAAAPILLGGAA